MVYKHGSVFVAVDRDGQWIGECDVPPGAVSAQRAHRVLWKLLDITGNTREKLAPHMPLHAITDAMDASFMLVMRPDL
jgi:hypothetical protein